QGMNRAFVETVDSLAVGGGGRMPEAVKKPGKQAGFVAGLYIKYFHREPEPAELTYALAQLARGTSQSGLKRQFVDVGSKTSKQISAQTFVNALFSTIGGRPATPVSEAYWLEQVRSGVSRQQVRAMFQASEGKLPPPTVTWVTPAPITYGTPLSSVQLNATAS